MRVSEGKKVIGAVLTQHFAALIFLQFHLPREKYTLGDCNRSVSTLAELSLPGGATVERQQEDEDGAGHQSPGRESPQQHPPRSGSLRRECCIILWWCTHIFCFIICLLNRGFSLSVSRGIRDPENCTRILLNVFFFIVLVLFKLHCKFKFYKQLWETAWKPSWKRGRVSVCLIHIWGYIGLFRVSKW